MNEVWSQKIGPETEERYLSNWHGDRQSNHLGSFEAKKIYFC